MHEDAPTTGADTAAEHGGDAVPRVVHDQQVAVLQERISQLERYARRMAHELQTPLTTARGFASLLLDRGPWDDGTQDALERVLASTERAQEVVRTVLDQDRAVVPVALDPLALLTAAADALVAQRPSASVLLPDALPEVVAPPPLLRRVVDELLAALVARSEHGAVTVAEGTGGDGSVLLRFSVPGEPLRPEEVAALDGRPVPEDDPAAGLHRARTLAAALASSVWPAPEQPAHGIAVSLAVPRREALDRDA